MFRFKSWAILLVRRREEEPGGLKRGRAVWGTDIFPSPKTQGKIEQVSSSGNKEEKVQVNVRFDILG